MLGCRETSLDAQTFLLLSMSQTWMHSCRVLPVLARSVQSLRANSWQRQLLSFPNLIDLYSFTQPAESARQCSWTAWRRRSRASTRLCFLIASGVEPIAHRMMHDTIRNAA